MNPESFSTRQIVLFGAHGQLGSHLMRALVSSRVRIVAWDEVSHQSESELRGFFSRSGEEPIDFIFANGVTDPKLSNDELTQSNVEFPMRVIRATAGESSACPHRYLSFGTIQENFPEVCRSNAYLQSKFELFQRMGELSGEGRFLHFRIHTLYGGYPKPHMFLGQMLSAILEKRVFEMSSGDQLREYHHAEDAAHSILTVLNQRWDQQRVLELSSGKPVRLADLARGVFQALGVPELLKVGALPRHQAENTQRIFPRSPSWLLGRSREPISGVVESLRPFLSL